MNNQPESNVRSSCALELFQPSPNALYSLDEAAQLACVPRRSILLYCRRGFVEPVFQPPYGIMAFTEETIQTVRRIEEMRTVHGVGVAWIKSMFDLVGEVDRLRAELRFFRNR